MYEAEANKARPAQSSIDELTKLSHMLDEGKLTGEEFEAAKRKALGL